jgi:5-methylcytosine-specific restriction endonuclease McrA
LPRISACPEDGMARKPSPHIRRLMKAKKRRKLNYGRDWTAISESVKARAGYCCQFCGRGSRRRVRLQSHHIVPFVVVRIHTPSNLIALCYHCHQRVHKAYRANKCTTPREFRVICASVKRSVNFGV